MKSIHGFTITAIISTILIGVRSDYPGLDKVIIDTDAGADDALAILLLLRAENPSLNKGYKIIAITCLYGNTYVENVEQNVLKTLTIADRSDIPVYSGAHKPLLYDYIHETYFGNDGLGDFNFTEPLITNVNRSVHAAVEMINLVKRYPGEVTLLALGPLTNIATAITLDPLFISRLKAFIILGSSVAGVGNRSPNVEFNFYQDPESNFIVLNSTDKTPAVLVPWETVLGSDTTKDWRINKLGNLNSRITHFLNNAERISLNSSISWHSADGMAAALIIRPDLAAETISKNVSPVTDGMARGSVLVDYGNRTGKLPNAIIVQGFKTREFQSMLLEHFA